MNQVYITATASNLPGHPFDNNEIQKVIKENDELHRTARKLTLKNNGIRFRYYAGKGDNNASLCAQAILKLENTHFTLDQIELLACGTSSPDQLLPSHTSMVHGALSEISASPIPACEIAGLSGICCSGIFALKYGYMSVCTGNSQNAVATGSEFFSNFMKEENFDITPTPDDIAEMKQDPYTALGKKFLRWMLSDGAGAVLLENRPNMGNTISFRIEWIELLSYANELETCMYAGAIKDKKGNLRGWREYELSGDMPKRLMTIKQDIKLINREMARVCIEEILSKVIKKRDLQAESVDYFLVHLSSFFFANPTYNYMKKINFDIPRNWWFTNLGYVGNIGAGSIYVMLDEIAKKGIPLINDKSDVVDQEKRKPLKKGQKILCVVPESGRFSCAYMLLTVV